MNRKFTVVLIATTAIGVAACSSNTGSSRGASPPAASATPAAAETTSPPVATRAPAPTRPPARQLATTFGDGEHLVGIDIAAGRYRTKVPADSTMCYWERAKDTTHGPQSIIANGLGEPGNQVVVTILPTDAVFEVRDCGTWTKV